jgi:hypothetical protein
MAVTEKQRHDLFTKIEQTLGTEHAATMMELLPPVGWADVATKQDIDALRREMATKSDLNDALHGLRRDMATWLFSAMGIQTAVIGILLVITR